MSNNRQKVLIFDTTMRDGELMPNITMNLSQKIAIAKLLEGSKVDIIEVGYPGVNSKDFAELKAISPLIKQSVICGLAGSNKPEIETLGEAIKNAMRGRINIYTNVNTKYQSKLNYQDILEQINQSITLAKNYCDDIQWSAFDAVRSDRYFLYRAIETAITSGAKTICIPDTFGTLDPNEFSDLITQIVNNVINSDRAIFSVHCHEDRGLAVENSLAGVVAGVRQIECSLNGLGARKGNADITKIVQEIANYQEYQTSIDVNLIAQTSLAIDNLLGK
ncbi:2-isopropylmalate synthase [Hyella patelloides LEGE 07179]|uniref:2-isopropylmalate synthase n=1 Tax=Hyella patelloides LEGE 07179 TaxID=945734 RepID=A0A563VJ28_9CYAN|nr:2-isopropylmalate synthase [Hyella patelloides]VEP11393.1 2-isopropylmalate synthase [Hyella patelloides LEGE 07179]